MLPAGYLVGIVSSNKPMESLETKTKSGLLRVVERLVGIVLGGLTLHGKPEDSLEGQNKVKNAVGTHKQEPARLNHVSRYTRPDLFIYYQTG